MSPPTSLPREASTPSCLAWRQGGLPQTSPSLLSNQPYLQHLYQPTTRQMFNKRAGCEMRDANIKVQATSDGSSDKRQATSDKRQATSDSATTELPLSVQKLSRHS
jgi:hypothetical protein